MNQLKISTRLALLIGFLTTLLLVIGGIGLYGMTKGDAALDTVYTDRAVPLGQLGEIRYLIISNRLLIANALIVQTPEVVVKRAAIKKPLSVR